MTLRDASPAKEKGGEGDRSGGAYCAKKSTRSSINPGKLNGGGRGREGTFQGKNYFKNNSVFHVRKTKSSWKARGDVGKTQKNGGIAPRRTHPQLQ